MKTDSVFCSLSKKCKEEYSKEVSQKIQKEEAELVNIYSNEAKEDE